MSGVNELLELLKHDGSNFPFPDGLDELLEWLIYDGDVLDGKLLDATLLDYFF
jgi:hypothetical protein